MGKGVAASSLGALLESRGLNVRMVKCDPYLNVNAGTMSPYQHGEIYVTDDGAETDLDLGNYERFTSGPLGKANSITTGQVYESVIRKEREGRYLGRCVQVIPHITDEIKSRILAVSKEYPGTDIIIVEIGGTVGDIELVPFLEAARQMIHECGRTSAISVLLTLIPEIGEGELKTKPTQHSVKNMQESGIQPDLLICRAPVMLDENTRRKIAIFTNVETDAVFTSCDVNSTIYEIPIIFFNQKLDQVVLKKLGLENGHADMRPWNHVMERFAARKDKVRIAVVGKHVDMHDSYKSVYEALFHAGLECAAEVELVKIEASTLEEAGNTDAMFSGIDGLLIPGGFGQRGINGAGMVKAANWARLNKVPYFGICMGMHIMAVEWARNVLNWGDADSTEFNPDTKRPVVSLLEEQGGIKYGGNMRLGASETAALEDTCIFAAYNGGKILERHRHRYEFSNKYKSEMVESGLKIAALSADGMLVDCIEWPCNPWGLGVQFHPEFKSKPTAAAPLFRDFIAAAKNKNGGGNA